MIVRTAFRLSVCIIVKKLPIRLESTDALALGYGELNKHYGWVEAQAEQIEAGAVDAQARSRG